MTSGCETHVGSGAVWMSIGFLVEPTDVMAGSWITFLAVLWAVCGSLGSVFTPVTLSTTPNVTGADHSHEPPGSLVWIIVGVVTAVAVVVILITVIAIAINRRKCKFHAVTKGKPSNKEYDDFEEDINVVYHPADGQCPQVTDAEQHYYSTPFDVTSKMWSATTTPTDIIDKEGPRHVTALYD
ncbi:hypothetical protein C0Q70_12679 [Pomacea canaliculata]|uniref:Uncharacterized protein n=1 Tax=Pomacea canaliculata TaxID=400727 RepID=A0A2T7P265_POMCA|nr:hypothetical protein C0Q70_12679 [Pomacea canaliculata]